MDAKEAVALAKQHVQELFASENILNLGLEELEFDKTHRVWQITLGFSRPWDVYNGTPLIERNPARTYKRIFVSDADKRILSVKNRDVAET
ncbi:MAG: hypothetical protein WDN08_19020 [Rhizomicrobium sp.]